MMVSMPPGLRRRLCHLTGAPCPFAAPRLRRALCSGLLRPGTSSQSPHAELHPVSTRRRAGRGPSDQEGRQGQAGWAQMGPPGRADRPSVGSMTRPIAAALWNPTLPAHRPRERCPQGNPRQDFGRRPIRRPPGKGRPRSLTGTCVRETSPGLGLRGWDRPRARRRNRSKVRLAHQGPVQPGDQNNGFFAGTPLRRGKRSGQSST
jgi:hypothetical protein